MRLAVGLGARSPGPGAQPRRDPRAVDLPGGRQARTDAEPGAEVAAHRARVGRAEDDRPRGSPRRRAARPASNCPPMPWPCSPGLTPKSDRPHTPSRTSASATPTISPSSSATHAPAGIAVAEVRDPDPRAPRELGARRRVVGPELDRVEHLERRAADGGGAGDVVGQHEAGDGGRRHGRRSQPRPAPDPHGGAVRRPLPFGVAHGRPEAEAVAQPHDQASFAAQDQLARDQRVPAVPQPAPSAPGLPRVRHLRRPSGPRA